MDVVVVLIVLVKRKKGACGEYLTAADQAASGLAAPHLKHALLDAKTLAPQSGQVQSPGRTFAVDGLGFGVPHLKQELFEANTLAPQLGHSQSPGLDGLFCPPNPPA